jgi:hypothetical protein
VGTGGGRLRFALLARRLVVVLLVCCASRIVGVAAQAASATSMAIRILRENIITH